MINDAGVNELALSIQEIADASVPNIYSKKEISNFVCNNLKIQYEFSLNNSKTTIDFNKCTYFEEKNTFGIVVHQFQDYNQTQNLTFLKGQSTAKIVSHHPNTFLFTNLYRLEAYKAIDRER